MVELVGRLVLAGVLVAAAGAKLASPRSSAAAMATYGFRPGPARWAAWGFVVLAELGLAVGVAAGSDSAAYAAAGLMALFALTLLGALWRGKAGAPCACFGSRSSVSGWAVARNAALAVGFAAVPSLPGGSVSTEEWLALGIVVALIACVGLAIALLALAREVGMLRLRLGPQVALEIDGEGPELGGEAPPELIERLEPGPRGELALAVFTSEGCRVCAALRPAVDSLRGEPGLAVATIEEGRDSELWEALGIPGAPYAVALDPGGTMLAKGTFNNLAQLESVLAAADSRRRSREASRA